jgi:hypothetical protein
MSGDKVLNDNTVKMLQVPGLALMVWSGRETTAMARAALEQFRLKTTIGPMLLKAWAELVFNYLSRYTRTELETYADGGSVCMAMLGTKRSLWAIQLFPDGSVKEHKLPHGFYSFVRYPEVHKQFVAEYDGEERHKPHCLVAWAKLHNVPGVGGPITVMEI